MNTSIIGNRELCAWKVAPGVMWVQTRSPRFARKLSQRSDSRLVAFSISGCYLQTFEFQQDMAWAKRLIARYQSENGTPTNTEKITPTGSPLRRKAKTLLWSKAGGSTF